MKGWCRRAQVVIGLALILLLWVNLSITAQSAMAGETKEKEGAQYNLNLTLADNLLLFKGKTVTVTLSSGQTVSGAVKDVDGKTGLLHLEKITQKEMYDALILIKDISAIQARFR